MPQPLPYSLQVTFHTLELMTVAAEASAQAAKKWVRRRRPAHLPCRQPGPATPMWNAMVGELRPLLKPYGAQARLARYLGLPRQRINDFLSGSRRLPDAETTLRLLHWLGEKQAGRDPSL